MQGKLFEPDEQMKKILTDAAAVDNAAGRVLNRRYSVLHSEWSYYSASMWGNMHRQGGAFFESPPSEFKDCIFKPFSPTAPEPNRDGSTTIDFGPTQPEGVKRGNWIQTDPKKGRFTILRLDSPLEPFFTKKWRPSEIKPVS